ncbi:cysteine-rich tail protein 1-like [Discoglossus pictus]
MDKGSTIQNPYASVNIPRAQLKSSFVRNTLGEDLDSVVIANPAAVPTYPSYSTQPQDRYSNEVSNGNGFEGNKIRTQESWRRPYNPYATDKPQNGGHPDTMYNVDLDRRYKDSGMVEDNACCCYPCCKCCSCCAKSSCVIS